MRLKSPFSDSRLPVLYGYHAVREALRSPRRIFRQIFATSSAARGLAAELTKRGQKPILVSAHDLTTWLGEDALHQGIVAQVEPLPVLDIEDIRDHGLVLVLDQITDPRNVGAILRTAAAFEVDALIVQERHSPPLTKTLAKSASGGLEHVPVIPVVNLARALARLGQRGYWRVGLDSQAPTSLRNEPLQRPLALILGAEDVGLRRLTREHCDSLARLDLKGPIQSLNVSNACAIVLALAQTAMESEGMARK